MTAVEITRPRAGTAPAPSTGDLVEVLDRFEPISLADLNAQARLMTRIDRKYFVPRDLFVDLLERTRADFRALEIDGHHSFRYRTVYFDTPEFGFFRAHVQGRRQRYKVRTRTYSESGDCLIEVKSKGYRGRTVKERIEHAGPAHLLDRPSREFVGRIVGSDAYRLEPVLETVYDRLTLVRGDQRLTCDLDLHFLAGSDRRDGPNEVLVETKSGGERGIWDDLLMASGIREHRVSKYCVSAALLYPGLPANPWRRTIRRYFGSR
ncbi:MULTISPECIES: polyphosphate polymerase domain-containing protein [unclassified Pseudactinotalea]|uniref:polyphosphate polymerase domain-containing protein n=1 Tax=unclassified Pseudactinotalea TaxID=2649176 RepID=UPI00128B8E5C|nr:MULTISPECIES: polyphosphate polymerase domain-containing protein [unclassified Pseudactinotalea]MPV48845.1 VTC domain-containing protein [Pseudactinotalea sp. HY160]QGH68821.1 VTC domain-containing protein [Pseudactinotalea sp. HY158]